jgi:hypothetical protein
MKSSPKYILISAFAVMAFSANVFAQRTPPPVKPQPPQPAIVVVQTPPNEVETTERSIATDPRVSIKLCVAEGVLKVNGWNRDEIRLFVKNGSTPGIKVLETNQDTNKPNWILISRETNPGKMPEMESDCISGQNIELDVPMSASLEVRGRNADITADSVRKFSIKNIEGNISLRNISSGITASTFQGDITAEDSGGAISLESSAGNILAYGIKAGQIGETFRAKTASGAISLQNVGARQIDANSISGSVRFVGKFAGGGIYNFKTSNGSIELNIPTDSSATFKASYGFGSFNSELPLKILYKDEQLPVRNLGATCGSGEANVVLTTNSGIINITDQTSPNL